MSTTETAPPPPAAPRRAGRTGLWLTLLGLLIAAPIVVTGIGAATAPPHAARVPSGRIVYLDADQVSERTTALRGLRVTLPGGGSRELVHEIEPPADSAPREWISQPACSPNGKWVAFVKQLITIQEETHTNITQIWAMPVDVPHAKPHLLVDLSARKLKPVVGLAWTPDSRNVVFLEDTLAYTVAAQGPPTVTHAPLWFCPVLKVTPELSATRNPVIGTEGMITFVSVTTARSASPLPSAPAPEPGVEAVAGNESITVRLAGSGRGGDLHTYPVRWGWSLFGGRKITSLHWSPEGRYIGFTVSKPPVPEDEVFYLNTRTGKTYQLPFRTGRASWDWTR